MYMYLHVIIEHLLLVRITMHVMYYSKRLLYICVLTILFTCSSIVIYSNRGADKRYLACISESTVHEYYSGSRHFKIVSYSYSFLYYCPLCLEYYYCTSYMYCT